MADEPIEAKWIQVQQKTFTRWCNTFLLERDLKIVALDKDLQDGVMLFSLLEILAGEQIKPKLNKNAKMKLQKIENLNFSMNFLRTKNIKLVNISSEDIYEQKKKLILGLIWTLILRFQIQQVEQEDDGKNSVKKDLLEWCNRALNPQGVFVKDFTGDWQDSAAFSGLVNYCRGEPNIDLAALDRKSNDGRLHGLDTAFNKAEEFFGFPKLLDAQDLLESPDELSVMTYVSYFRGYKTENTACAAKSIAYGPGLTDAKTHREAGYTVELKNDEGERIKLGGAKVSGIMVLNGEKSNVSVKDNRNGTYACTYVVAKPGTYELQVLCDGQHIKDSPFHPVVTPSEAFADNCTADPKSPVVAGEKTEFVVVTRDSGNNAKPDGGEQITAALGDAVKATVVDKADGKYDVSYTPEQAGDFKLAVQLKGADIKGSPFAVTVLPANPDAAHTTAQGAGISKADTDSPATFVVTTRDRFDNKCITGGFKVNSALKGAASVPVTVIDNNDGTYGATYQATKAGQYTLDVTLAGANIKAAPFTVVVSPGKATAGTTTAEGDGLKRVVAGETGKFAVQTHDKNNNALTVGGDKITGALKGPAGVDVNVVDNKNGSYAGRYVPKVVGQYTLDITHDGKSIHDSPFKVEVVPAGPNAGTTEASGDGIKHANTDTPAKFKIQTKDAFGNNCVTGGAPITVAVNGPNNENAKANVKDNKDGTYDVDYQPKGSGDFVVDVKLGGENIKDAPFKVKVDPGKAVAGNSVADGDGLRQVVAGETGKFTVQTKDANNNLLHIGGSKVTGKLSGTAGIDCDVADNKNGTYAGTYVPKKSGKYQLAVNVDGGAVKGSPFSVLVVPAAAVANESLASDTGLSSAVAGVPAVAAVQTRDRFQNECIVGGDKVTATISGPAGSQKADIKDFGNGKYRVKYTGPNKAGAYKLSIQLAGHDIKDSPFSVTVATSPGSAAHSSASGDGLKKVVAGEEGKFVVEVNDEFGNRLPTGGHAVLAVASGPRAFKPTIVDNKNGSYNATYVPTVAGGYKLALTIDGDAVPGSPFAVQVVPAAANGPKSIATGKGLTKAGVGTPGKEGVFVVEARDQFGNKCVTGGANLKGVLKGGDKKETIQIGVKDNKNGTYNCDYDIETRGEYTLTVTIDDKPVHHSPYTVLARPGATDPTKTAIVGDTTKSAAGLTSFKVQLKDKKGNPRHKGGDDVKVRFERPVTTVAKARDANDGTFDVEVPPELQGQYDVIVNVGGHDIKVGQQKIDNTPLTAAESDEVKQKMPGASDALLRLLAHATPAERAAVLADLRTGLKPDAELDKIRANESAERQRKIDDAGKAKQAAREAKKAAKIAREQKLKDEIATLDAAEAEQRAKAAEEEKALASEMATASAAEKARRTKQAEADRAAREKEQEEFERKLAAASNAARDSEAKIDADAAKATAAADKEIASAKAEEKATHVDAKPHDDKPQHDEKAAAAAAATATATATEEEEKTHHHHHKHHDEPAAEPAAAAAAEPAAAEPAAVAAEPAAAAAEPAAAAVAEPTASVPAVDVSAADAALSPRDDVTPRDNDADGDKKSKKSGGSRRSKPKATDAAPAATPAVEEAPKETAKESTPAKKEKKTSATPAVEETPVAAASTSTSSGSKVKKEKKTTDTPEKAAEPVPEPASAEKKSKKKTKS